MSEGNNVFQVIGQIGDDYEKAKKLANYWKSGNKENREKEKERARELKARECAIIENFKKVWVSMIITTILIQIFFSKIVLWCGIQGDFIEFAIITGIAIVLNAIIGVIIYCS